jgi:hypothetical protein
MGVSQPSRRRCSGHRGDTQDRSRTPCTVFSFGPGALRGNLRRSTTGSGAGGTLIRVTPLDRWERRTGLSTVVLVRAPGRAQVDLLVDGGGCGHGVVLASWSSNLLSYSPNLSRILRARSASSSERSYASLLTSPIRRSRSAQPWPPGSCGGNVGSTGDLPDKSLEEPSTASIGWAAPLRGGQGTQPAYIWHTRAHEKGP